MTVAMARARELLALQLLTGDGTGNNIEGLYNNSDVGSSANLVSGVSDITVAIIEAALQASFQSPPAGRRIICSPGAAAQMRTLARPSAVDSLVEADGTINNVPVMETGAFGSRKPARAVVGPVGDLLVKQWDNAIFVSREYRAGNYWLSVEMFANAAPAHPARWHRLRQN